MMYPEPEDVFATLGDKIVDGLASSVRSGADDLATYRRELPQLASRHRKRGWANVLHDYIWHHVQDAFDGLHEVRLRDDGVTREVGVLDEYRLRLKKHGSTGQLSNYPTHAALDFMTPSEDLFGKVTWNLTFGYLWDDDTSTAGEAVISLRDGDFENPRWMVAFPSAAASGSTVRPTLPEPPSVGIETPRSADDEASNREEDE